MGWRYKSSGHIDPLGSRYSISGTVLVAERTAMKDKNNECRCRKEMMMREDEPIFVHLSWCPLSFHPEEEKRSFLGLVKDVYDTIFPRI